MLQIQTLRFKSVLWGVLVDTIGTLVVATVLFLAMAASGIPEAEITIRIHSFSGLLLMLITGLGFTLTGGYVAGRTAGLMEMLHGALVGGIGMVLGLCFREPNLPLWYEIISFAAMIPIGMAGGSIARAVNRKKDVPEHK